MALTVFWHTLFKSQICTNLEICRWDSLFCLLWLEFYWLDIIFFDYFVLEDLLEKFGISRRNLLGGCLSHLCILFCKETCHWLVRWIELTPIQKLFKLKFTSLKFLKGKYNSLLCISKYYNTIFDTIDFSKHRVILLLKPLLQAKKEALIFVDRFISVQFEQ